MREQLTKALLLIVRLTLVISIAGCGFPGDRNAAFPVIPAVPPVDVFILSGKPAERICVLETQDDAKRFVWAMRERFPSGWKSGSRYVSFAPTYRIVLGTTEILVLKQGLVVSFATSTGERTVLIHELAVGEGKSFVESVCGIRRSSVEPPSMNETSIP